MQVQKVNNNPNFGMAVYADIPRIERCLGRKIAGNISEALPSIENMARDVDVVIEPAAYIPILFKREFIKVTAKQPNLSFWEKLKSALRLRPPYKAEEWMSAKASSSDWIIRSCNEAIANLLNYIK